MTGPQLISLLSRLLPTLGGQSWPTFLKCIWIPGPILGCYCNLRYLPKCKYKNRCKVPRTKYFLKCTLVQSTNFTCTGSKSWLLNLVNLTWSMAQIKKNQLHSIISRSTLPAWYLLSSSKQVYISFSPQACFVKKKHSHPSKKGCFRPNLVKLYLVGRLVSTCLHLPDPCYA